VDTNTLKNASTPGPGSILRDTLVARGNGGNTEVRTEWYTTPDTSGGRYREMEILPSSMASDSTWNCTLYVDHHGDRAFGEAALEEQGLQSALGPGGNTSEGTRYDRWDVETPSSGQLSFGRPIQTNYGASIVQTFNYRSIVWHCATLSALQLTDEDATMLGP
jgi:hypothetical protein